MQCREVKELLSPYLDGVLSPSEGADISAHLAVCPDCRDEWLALCEVVDMFQALPEVAPPPDFSARVTDKIASTSNLRKKSRVAAIIKKLTRGRWSPIVAIAASAVLVFGVTALMYGAPGRWGAQNLFWPHLSVGQNAGENIPGSSNNESVDSPGSGEVNMDVNNVAGVDSHPGEVRPEQSGVKTDLPTNSPDTKYVAPLNSRLEEQVEEDNRFPSPVRALSTPRTMAVKEGVTSQQAAFGSIPASNKESRKIIRSASVGLSAADPDRVPEKVAAIAWGNGGYLLQGDSGSKVITIKVPSGRFNQVINSIREIGKVTLRQSEDVDVTEKYYNYETGLRELAAEEQRLLMEVDGAGQAAAGEAQAQLARVRENLQHQKELLNSLSEQVELATIKISLE